MEWTKKTWQVALIITIVNILFSGVVAFSVNAFSAREQTLQGAASVSYVDKQDSAINAKICTQDIEMNTMGAKIDTKADKEEMAAVHVTVNNIYNLLLAMATDKQKEAIK